MEAGISSLDKCGTHSISPPPQLHPLCRAEANFRLGRTNLEVLLTYKKRRVKKVCGRIFLYLLFTSGSLRVCRLIVLCSIDVNSSLL